MKHQVIIKLNYRWLLGIMLSVALLFSVVSSFVPLKVRATGIGPTRIVGYAGSQGTNYQYIEWNKLTDVVIETLAVTSSTDPTIMDATGSNFTMLINISKEAKAVNPGIQVLAQLTGGNWQSWDDGHLTAIMDNSTNRSQLATNLASFVSTYDLDGIDIDWEGTDITEANYHAFLVALRADLPLGKIISVDAPAAIDFQPATDYAYWFNPTADSPYINWYDIMSYGFSYSDFITYANQWINAGFPVSQLDWGYNANEDSQADNIDLVSEKVDWTLTQGAGGEMIWMVDHDVNGNSQLFVNTMYAAIYPTIATSNSVLNTTTSSLSNGTVGTADSQILTVTGGKAQHKWAIISSMSHTGQSFTFSDAISRTSTTADGQVSITFQATDETGINITKTLSSEINAATKNKHRGN
jgi:hypothetical protein